MKKFIILIPVYNDWNSVIKLLENIDLQITEWKAEVSVIIIDDASTEERLKSEFNFKNLKSIRIMSMKKNLGHARCNATGLKYLNEKENFDYVIPMDGDGEDRPEELVLLFNQSQKYPDKVITGNRIKRTEGPLFKFCYLAHKFLTYFFTGKSIKFGNYTCLPKAIVSKMTENSATWSSFSGSLAKLTDEKIGIPSIKGLRYFGPSKMSFFKLLIHSFSIIAVFRKKVLLRSLIFLTVYLFLVFKSLSFVTLIPVFFIAILLFLVFWFSKRENLKEFNQSLSNILSINNFS